MPPGSFFAVFAALGETFFSSRDYEHEYEYEYEFEYEYDTAFPNFHFHIQTTPIPDSRFPTPDSRLPTPLIALSIPHHVGQNKKAPRAEEKSARGG
jgi:hypothetical protein